MFKSEPSTQKTEENWWDLFKSQPSTQESTTRSFEMTQQSQSQSQDNQEKDDNDDDNKEKNSFYLKLGKNKRFK